MRCRSFNRRVPLTPHEFLLWMRKAKPGERCIYYSGDFIQDLRPLSKARRKILNDMQVRTEAFAIKSFVWICANGWFRNDHKNGMNSEIQINFEYVSTFQARNINHMGFDYIAERTKKRLTRPMVEKLSRIANNPRQLRFRRHDPLQLRLAV